MEGKGSRSLHVKSLFIYREYVMLRNSFHCFCCQKGRTPTRVDWCLILWLKEWCCSTHHFHTLPVRQTRTHIKIRGQTRTSTFKYIVQTVNYVSGTLSIFTVFMQMYEETDSQFQVLLHSCGVLWLPRGKTESRVFALSSSHFDLFNQNVLVTSKLFHESEKYFE